MNEFFQGITVGTIGAAFPLGVLIWLFKLSIKKIVESSVDHEYEKLSLEYKNQLEIRSRAQLIAELLAEWMSTPIDGGMTSDQRKQLNKLSFEASLWLPEEIARDLSKVLQLQSNAPNQFDILLRVREYLSGPHKLNSSEITQWTREAELPNYGLAKGIVHGEIAAQNIMVKIGDSEVKLNEDKLIDGYEVPGNAYLVLEIKNENGLVRVETQNIRGIRMKKHEKNDGDVDEIRILVNPLSAADEINSKLFPRID